MSAIMKTRSHATRVRPRITLGGTSIPISDETVRLCGCCVLALRAVNAGLL